MPADDVFTISDFRGGLDARKTALTAPEGTLRILENAVINQGGEIEKRLAFVPVCTLPADVTFIFGQGKNLHVFTPVPLVIDPGTCPVPIVQHNMFGALSEGFTVDDCETYKGGFQLSVTGSVTGNNYVIWGNDSATPLVPYLPLSDADGQIHGTFSRTFRSKMYRIDGEFLRFSGVGDPSVLDPASVPNPGAGFTDIAEQDPDAEDLAGMEVYYNSMAIMSRLLTTLWTLDPDPTKDQITQTLRIGTVAPHSILQFGTGDVLFLSDSGVRSLHAMAINLAASVSDVGSAIDPILAPVIRDNAVAAAKARATIQPIYGRYWLHLNGKIYVLSYFPAGNITAWSVLDPGFVVQEFAVVQNMVFARGPDNTLYLYGGLDLNTYDSCTVTVRTPHQAIETPTTNKRIKSLDVMCMGAWSLSAGMLPNNVEAFELVANIQDNTYGLKSIPFAGYGTHLGLQLVHQAPGPATLAAIHANVQPGVVK
jgi:hypothetical protein